MVKVSISSGQSVKNRTGYSNIKNGLKCYRKVWEHVKIIDLTELPLNLQIEKVGEYETVRLEKSETVGNWKTANKSTQSTFF